MCRKGSAEAIADWTSYRPTFSRGEFDIGALWAIRDRNTLPFLLALANTDELSMFRRLGMLALLEDNPVVAALIHGAHVQSTKRAQRQIPVLNHCHD